MFKWLFKKKGCAKHMNNKLEVRTGMVCVKKVLSIGVSYMKYYLIW